MFYPGLDLATMTDEQVHRKIGELTSKLNRISNPQARSQLLGIIQAMKMHVQDNSIKKEVENSPEWKPGVLLDTEDLEVNKNNLDKLIDIS